MKYVLIIYYELANPGNTRELLLKKIKTYDGWARIGRDCYLIYTDQKVTDVRDTLTAILASTDKLFVGTSPAPSAWVGLPEEVSKWLHAKQK